MAQEKVAELRDVMFKVPADRFAVPVTGETRAFFINAIWSFFVYINKILSKI